MGACTHNHLAVEFGNEDQQTAQQWIVGAYEHRGSSYHGVIDVQFNYKSRNGLFAYLVFPTKESKTAADVDPEPLFSQSLHPIAATRKELKNYQRKQHARPRHGRGPVGCPQRNG
jgi:hypothetical protein